MGARHTWVEPGDWLLKQQPTASCGQAGQRGRPAACHRLLPQLQTRLAEVAGLLYVVVVVVAAGQAWRRERAGFRNAGLMTGRRKRWQRRQHQAFRVCSSLLRAHGLSQAAKRHSWQQPCNLASWDTRVPRQAGAHQNLVSSLLHRGQERWPSAAARGKHCQGKTARLSVCTELLQWHSFLRRDYANPAARDPLPALRRCSNMAGTQRVRGAESLRRPTAPTWSWQFGLGLGCLAALAALAIARWRLGRLLRFGWQASGRPIRPAACTTRRFRSHTRRPSAKGG